MDILDVFSGDAFRNVALSAYVNETAPFAPGLLSSLGLFTSEGIMSPDVAFEEIGGVLRLISSTPRGAPPSQQAHQKPKIRKLPTSHLKREAHINADELLGTRLVGSMSPATAQGLIDRRVEGPTGLKTEMAYTWEHMYLGAIDGQVYDGDNATILYDFFAFYGVNRPAALVLSFSTMTDKTGLLRAFAQKLKRQMTKALAGMAIGSAYPMVLCGDNFFDALTTCAEIVIAQRTGAFGKVDASDIVGQNLAYSTILFAGIVWVNYRGSDDTAVSVPTDEARAFMVGVAGLFQSYFAPADTFETISEVGLPFYLLQRPEAQTSSRRVFELQSNPLTACTRPLSLARITKS